MFVGFWTARGQSFILSLNVLLSSQLQFKSSLKAKSKNRDHTRQCFMHSPDERLLSSSPSEHLSWAFSADLPL